MIADKAQTLCINKDNKPPTFFGRDGDPPQPLFFP